MALCFRTGIVRSLQQVGSPWAGTTAVHTLAKGWATGWAGIQERLDGLRIAAPLVDRQEAVRRMEGFAVEAGPSPRY